VETKPAIIIMPEKKGYTFDPKSVTFENIASNKIQNFIGSAPALYTISGFVKDTNSDPLAATMILTGQKNRKILVDSITGYYQFDSLEAGKTFAVFPSRRGYKFTPNIKVFGTLASSQTQDFVGVKLVKDSLQTISGIISGNQGSFLKTSDFNLAGITVYLDDDNNNYVTQTDNSGIFVFDDVDLSPNYTITPYQAGTAFYPASQAIDATKDDNQPDMFISSISSATGVEPVTNQLPGEIHLYNNYPNPFNPSTIIKYSLPSTLDVKIEVYDIMGRLVTKLFDGKQNSGNYEITFNAGNISSGVYFVKLRSGSTVKSISINLLK
jgi:hypothetical protein